MTALSEGWQRYLQKEAGKLHVSVDSTFNIDRILRVPGTRNHKWGVDVEIEAYEETLRYNGYDLDDYIVFNEPQVSLPGISPEQHTPSMTEEEIDAAQQEACNGIVFDFRNAQPPPDKFAALCEVEPKFKASWEHRRRGLKDQSPSGYDLALASVAAHNGWTDQEIVNLLIAHRRKYNALGKLIKRKDYFFHPSYGVITVALASVADRQALLEMQDAVDEAELLETARVQATAVVDEDLTEEEREEAAAATVVEEKNVAVRRRMMLEKVRKFTGMPIKRILKFGLKANGRYVVEMEDGTRESMGEIHDFRDMEKWVNLSCIYGSKIMMPMKKVNWLSAPF